MATFRRTRATEEIRFEETRRQEEAKNDLIRKVNADRVVVANASSDGRVDFKRRFRRMAQERAEQDFMDGLIAEDKRRDDIRRARAHEEALSNAMAKLETERVRDEKYRAQIRETAPELRELEAKLRAGYTSKELTHQISAREAAMEEETRRMHETARELAAAGDDYEEEQRQETLAKLEKTRRYQTELDDQLQAQETRRHEALQQFLKDKAMIDEIVLRIQEEDDAESRRQEERKAHTRAEQEAFEQQREEHKRKLLEQMQREDDIIARQAAEAQARESSLKAAKAGERAALEALQAEMGAEAARAREEAEEMDRVRQELYEEEMRVAVEERARADERKQQRMREELQTDRAEHLARMERLKQEEAAEEAEFRQAMMEKFARDDKLEQMSAQKRRMKALEHRRAIEALMEDRRTRIAHEREMEERARQDEQDREAVRREVIEQERQRMLREHAVKLLGYLPKGVITGDADLDMLGEEFKERYSRRRNDDDDLAY
eukprot:m.36114 g.36114  ORF g.36114 m.36114 type:complete len:495 (-) comp7533_c0_seq1:1382-2866(-)